jgi:lactoylglutathione lyase
MKSRLTYVGIRVTDLEKSIEFYTKVLGMTVAGRGKIDQTKGENVGLQTEAGGYMLELNYYGKDSQFNTKYVAGDGLDHIAFKVDDLDKALEEAEKAGHRTVLQMEAGGNRWVYIEDPDGNWIELF